MGPRCGGLLENRAKSGAAPPCGPETPGIPHRQGGTTPLVATWLVSRTGWNLSPAVYLAAGGAVAFLAALRFPRTVPHPMTMEFSSLTFR